MSSNILYIASLALILCTNVNSASNHYSRYNEFFFILSTYSTNFFITQEKSLFQDDCGRGLTNCVLNAYQVVFPSDYNAT